MKLSERAVQARRRYMREWKRKNKDRDRMNQARFWEKKADEQEQEAKGG